MTPDTLCQELMSHRDFLSLKDYILKSTGLHYFADKDNDLVDRVSKRLMSLGIKDCGDYLRRLTGTNGAHELDLLVTELTIGETYFFRHSEQFDALRTQIIPDILARNRESRCLRIWSAGCSYGAEPYSVTILLRTHFQDQLQGWDVSVLATDINRDFLATAREAAYDEWAFRGTLPELKQRCFSQSGKKWVLAPEFRNGVTFLKHNLITDPFPPLGSRHANFDLILCRNVVIYFTQSDFNQTVQRFETCLGEGGWLLVGHAEPNLEMFGAFCIVSVPGAILYRRHGAQNHENAPNRAWTWPVFTPPIVSEPTTDSNTWTPPVVAENPKSGGLESPPESAEDLDALRRLADQGQWEHAAAGCERLLRSDNHNSRVHCFYALILEHLGRGEESEQALRRAVYFDRNSVLAHYFLGVRQQKNRDFALAARAFGSVDKLLSKLDDSYVFADAEGMTAGEMRQTVQMQMEALRACEKRSTGVL